MRLADFGSASGSEAALKILEEGYSSADSDSFQEDSDGELPFDWAVQDDSDDDQPQTRQSGLTDI